MVAAGVGIWVALLSWAVEALYGLLPNAAAAVLATIALLSARRPPVLVACCVGGAYVATCVHTAPESAFWIFLAAPLAIMGGGAVVATAWVGSSFRDRAPGTVSR